MSTAAATLPYDATRDRRPSLVALARVELRKMYDTRAGFWLLLSGLLLALGTAALSVFTGHDRDHTLSDTLNNTTQALNVLVPIVGILLVTSEWSQRTAQVTFTLVPHRGRVLSAKLLAAAALAAGAFLAALAMSALGVAINPSGLDGTWSIGASLFTQILLFDIISMLVGVAFGAAFLLSAPAIVASFVLTLGYSVVVHLLGLDGLADWTDQTEALAPLTDHGLSATEWARVGTTLLLWLVLPLTIGAWRFLRGEIR
jgi:ABC-2 type transport system permease protein